MAIVCGEGGSTTQEVFDEINAKVTQADIVGAIGNINNPLLDLPLNNSLAMKQGVGSVTFTRATTATYIDRYGVLQYAAIDGPRFEKDGLLIEGGSTNLLLESEDLSDSNWVGYYDTTVTTDGTTSTDGTTEMFKISANGTANTSLRQTVVVPANSVVTHSVNVKRGNYPTISMYIAIGGGTALYESCTYNFDNDTIGVGSSDYGTLVASRRLLANGVVRIQMTDTDQGSNTNDVIQINGTTESDYYVYADKPQIEILPFASSYIPTTTTAVTRGADICELSLNNAIAVNNDFTISVDSTINRPLFSTYHSPIFTMDGVDATYRDRLLLFRNYSSDLDKIFPFALVSMNSGSIDSSIAGFKRITLTKDDSLVKSYADGVQYHSRAVDASSIVNGVSYLQIGGWATSAYLYGHIKNFRIWDKELTPTEVALA